MARNINVVILAAGKGTRMYSSRPKVLHTIAGKSLLQHVVDTATELNSSAIQVVIGHQAEQVQATLAESNTGFVIQEQQLGTAHAVHQALPALDMDACALVLYGDVPLIKAETLDALLELVDSNSMAVLGSYASDPFGLGRLIRNKSGKLVAIVEEKDANAEQKAIREVNTGIMAIPVKKLHDWLPRISTDNAQAEYYLTDIVKLAIADGSDVHTLICEDELETCGVNNRKQLALLERHYQSLQADKIMLSGVSLMDPQRFDLRGSLQAEQDVSIDVNVIIHGEVKLGEGVEIGANCSLKDCEIGAGTVIHPNTIIEDSTVGKDCSIGPFARIRPGTRFSDEVRIGNFVETKKAVVAKGSKINHLSYIGDSDIGEDVNVGAGTITCNYDGVNKFRTIIENRVFIGSNSALVAPVRINEGATIGAGSVITRDTPANKLTLSRKKQTTIDSWHRPIKK